MRSHEDLAAKRPTRRFAPDGPHFATFGLRASMYDARSPIRYGFFVEYEPAFGAKIVMPVK